jgi:hypothetical protein
MWGIDVIAILAMALSGIVWGIRQEGRTNAMAMKVEDNEEREVERLRDLKELINTKFDNMDDRLARIERGMNGHLQGKRYAS